MNDSDKRKLHDQVRLFTEESKAIDVEASRIYYLISAGNSNDDLIKDIKKLEKRIENFKADAGKIDLKKFNTDENEQDREFGITGSRISAMPGEKNKELGKIKKQLATNYNLQIEMLRREIQHVKDYPEGIVKKQTDASKKTKLTDELNNIVIPAKKNNPGRMVANSNIDDIDFKALEKAINQFRSFFNKYCNTTAETKNYEIYVAYHDATIGRDIDIAYIEEMVIQLDRSIQEYKYYFGTSVSSTDLDNDLDEIKKMILGADKYLTALMRARSSLSAEDYDMYAKRVQKVLKDLLEKEEAIKKAKDFVNNAAIAPAATTAYKGYKNELDVVQDKVKTFRIPYIVKLHDSNQKFRAEEIKKINQELDAYKEEYTKIKERYDADKSSGIIPEQLHKNLEFLYEGRINYLESVRKDLTEPKVIVEGDVNIVLGDSVESIKQGIDELREIYNNYGSKRVIPKKTRKEIDKLIAKIEEKIDLLKRNLDSIENDKRDEKYTKMLDSLKEQEDRLTSFKKDYRKKTPFLVKRKKSAKEWFKKHKKGLLIAVGIASVALLMQPLLIPAIMHGNIMLFAIHPSWKAALVGINNVLGKIIGAKTIGGAVTLANGVMITPVKASATILKALASIGLPTAAIATPLVAGIVDLAKKIKSGELKRQLKSGKDTIVNIPKKLHDRHMNRSNVHETKKELRRLKKILLEYERSRLSLTEFVNDKGLSDREKTYLETNATREHGGR